MPVNTGGKSFGRYFATTPAAKVLLTLLFLVPTATTTLCAQTIEIKLINGKSGHPVAGVCVGMWTSDTKMTVHVPTDNDGVARLRLTGKDNEVDISHAWKRCGANGALNPVLKFSDALRIGPTFDNPSCAFSESTPKARWKEMEFSTKEVLERGVVSENTCGKVTRSPQPGEIILFVRPRSFREKIEDWRNSDAFPF